MKLEESELWQKTNELDHVLRRCLGPPPFGEASARAVSIVGVAMRRTLLLILAIVTSPKLPAFAIDEFEQPPIEYSGSTPQNCVSTLQTALDRGDISVEY